MRKAALKVGGIFVLLAAMSTMALPAKPHAKVCNLLCIQGFHCVIVHGQPTCVPN